VNNTKKTQGNSLCDYLYLKLAKCSHSVFYVFSSTKSENRRVDQALRGGCWYWWEQGGGGERGRRMI
jgi:hypothetical protein